MKAVIYEEYGSADVLQFVDRELPKPSGRQLLIRAEACSVNPIDWRVRSGEAKYLIPFGFPRIPGYDLAGVVERAPKGCGFAVGDRVMAFLKSMTGGAYAEYVTCSPDVVAKIPDSMSSQDAAAMGLAGTTALQCLRDYGKLGVGQHVVVTGASGGVGSFAVQIAVARGARVTGIASSKNEELVRSLGAERFIDYHSNRYLRQVEPCDVFLDAAGKISFNEARLVMNSDAHFVTTEPSLQFACLSLLTAVVPGRTCRTMLARANSRDLRELVHLWSSDKLRVIRNEVFPLSEAGAAHRHGEGGHGTGKIVLSIN
ncbi:MAG: NAD(P)-dependent alcohol dehydrogenase [Aureliella sp.]